MEKLTAFERGQIVGALSTGASVAKTAELLNLPKDVVSQVMSAYSKHGQSALVELVKKKPQHRHKKPPTQISCGDISIGTSPIQALEKALALEKQAAGDEDDDDDDDEDMDDDDEDLNIKTINEDEDDEDDEEDEGSSEEKSDFHKTEGKP